MNSEVEEARKNIEDEARMMSERWYELFKYSSAKANEHSDNFVRNQSEIAVNSLLFSATLVGILGVIMGDEDTTIEMIILITGWISLFLSTVMGVINAHIKNNFWNQNTEINRFCFKAFDEVVLGRETLEVARKIQYAHTQGQQKVTSKEWPWICQSVFLGGGLFLVMTGIILFIFTK